MASILDSGKLLKLKTLCKEIIHIAENERSKMGTRLPENICQLLDNLIHMQSLSISIRAELIEKLLSIGTDLPKEVRKQVKDHAANITIFDSRKEHPNKRRFPTYRVRDRRSGIEDRRKKNRGAE